MEMGMLVAEFFLDGCTTLKDKRHRIGGLSDRFGKAQNVAVIESGFQNDHRRSEWTFVAIANNRVGVEKSLAYIEERLEQDVDGRLVASEMEWL